MVLHFFLCSFFLLNQEWRRWFTVVSPTSWLFVAYFRTYYTSLIHFSFRRLPECTGNERVKKCCKLHNISIDINIPLPLQSHSLSLGLKTCSNTPHVKSTDSQICPMATAIFWVTKEQTFSHDSLLLLLYIQQFQESSVLLYMYM